MNQLQAFQSLSFFCLDHRRVPSKDNQLNFCHIGNHGIKPSNTRPDTIAWHRIECRSPHQIQRSPEKTTQTSILIWILYKVVGKPQHLSPFSSTKNKKRHHCISLSLFKYKCVVMDPCSPCSASLTLTHIV